MREGGQEREKENSGEGQIEGAGGCMLQRGKGRRNRIQCGKFEKSQGRQTNTTDLLRGREMNCMTDRHKERGTGEERETVSCRN